MLLPKLLAWVMSAALHFVSPVPALNLLATGDDVTRTEDLAYAAGPRHALDIYVPAHAVAAPVVLFFYGGGWETGAKEMYRFVGHTLASQGILAVIPDYRLYPEVRFPGFVQDAAQAVAWVRSHAAGFGGDPHRLFLMGHSAGAHIAALLATDTSYLEAVNLSPEPDICGVIGLAGAHDFAPSDPTAFGAIFGPRANWSRAMPITFVSAATPPMLLLTGGGDATVAPGNTLRMAARLEASGVEAQVALYPGISHRALVVALGTPFTVLAPVMDDTMRFIASGGACGVEAARQRNLAQGAAQER